MKTNAAATVQTEAANNQITQRDCHCVYFPRIDCYLEGISQWNLIVNNSVVEEHIKNFIKNFVFGNKQERARLKLLPHSSSEWDEANLKLVTWLDFKRVEKLTAIEKSQESLRNKYGNKAGLYLDFSSEPRNLTLSEAAAIHFRPALFSMDSGKLVFFFTHDDDVYVCKAA